MDIQKIKTVLNRGVKFLEDAEFEALTEDLDEDLQALEESYVGIGGTEAPDHTPSGDPNTGAAGGVDNEESAEEQFYAYLMEVVQVCAARAEISEDAAVKHMEDFAEQLAAAGEIPAMPNPESGTAEEYSTWTGAAVTAGFERRLSEYVAAAKGQDPSVGTGSNAA